MFNKHPSLVGFDLLLEGSKPLALLRMNMCAEGHRRQKGQTWDSTQNIVVTI